MGPKGLCGPTVSSQHQTRHLPNDLVKPAAKKMCALNPGDRSLRLKNIGRAPINQDHCTRRVSSQDGSTNLLVDAGKNCGRPFFESYSDSWGAISTGQKTYAHGSSKLIRIKNSM